MLHTMCAELECFGVARTNFTCTLCFRTRSTAVYAHRRLVLFLAVRKRTPSSTLSSASFHGFIFVPYGVGKTPRQERHVILLTKRLKQLVHLEVREPASRPGPPVCTCRAQHIAIQTRCPQVDTFKGNGK